MPALIFMSVWKWAGYYAFIFLAALQGISEEYYEAATIDGANAWQKFWRITFPLISPTSFFILVTMIIYSAQLFDLVWITTKGGPSYATFPIVMLIYRHGFELLELGKASAIAVVLFVFILIVTVVQFRLQDRWVTYES
jgi:multiple sugar transport system permease protein